MRQWGDAPFMRGGDPTCFDVQHCTSIAISLVMLALLRSGDHLLVADSAYRSTKAFADRLVDFGIQLETYPARSGADIEALIRPETRLIWMESPGTITMEIQDVSGIVEAAKRHGVLTTIDNTWASPLGFSPLEVGVDICLHTCSKYMSGHSDVLMGSVSTRDATLYEKLRGTQSLLGQAPSPEDCYLVLRGLKTMRLRWEDQCSKTLQIAQHLLESPIVDSVYYQALSCSQDHQKWKSQFVGARYLLSLSLKGGNLDGYREFFSALKHFSIGASWGWVHSLVAFHPIHPSYCKHQQAL